MEVEMRFVWMYVATFAFALGPALLVRNHMPLAGFVVGSAAVAALITGGVRLARGGGWPRHVLTGAAVCTVAPFVAGGVTGLLVGLESRGTWEGMAEMAAEGLFGATLLWVPLAVAAAVAWLLALGAGAAFERFGPRPRTAKRPPFSHPIGG